MATVKQFEDLQCWKKSREVCRFLGEIIDKGKFKRSYRLIHQIEGSSGSIMDNIAEGFERGSKNEFILFLGYAKGSCGELRSQIYRVWDRTFLTQEEFDYCKALVIHISSLLQKFIAYLQQTTINGTRRKVAPKEH